MWWPALGGLAVGVGGLVQPHALGVGYDLIGDLLQGRFVPASLASLMLVKALIWILALGSGTSGGVLAPLLIMGGALGALEEPLLPGGGRALWPLISMGAILGGTMRSPLTGVVFALELTHDVHALLPLLIACVIGHAFTVLVLPRSILTEKVARRGYHLTREYTVDPLEAVTVDEVMSREVASVPAAFPARELERRFLDPRNGHTHQGYPVLDREGHLVGVITRSNLIQPSVPEDLDGRTVGELISQPPVIAYADETCRTDAERMADAEVGRLPVVERDNPRRLVGIVTRSDLLKARERYLELEQRRERLLWRGGR